MLTMLPPPVRRMIGTTALQQCQMPFTFTAMAASQSSSRSASNRPPLKPPYSAALLTSPSMRPNSLSAVCAILVTDAISATSTVTAVTCPPVCFTSSIVAPQSLTSHTTMRAPAAARLRAYSCPMPRAAPVITITFPSIRNEGPFSLDAGLAAATSAYLGTKSSFACDLRRCRPYLEQCFSGLLSVAKCRIDLLPDLRCVHVPDTQITLGSAQVVPFTEQRPFLLSLRTQPSSQPAGGEPWTGGIAE